MDGKKWLIIDASPDIRAQLSTNAVLWPTALRETPIASVILTNGDVDHVAGLLTLRERQPFRLLATAGLLDVLPQNPMLQVLDPLRVEQEAIPLETSFFPLEGLQTKFFSVPGKVPLYLERDTVELQKQTDQTVGVEFLIGDSRCYYIPGCAEISTSLQNGIAGAELLFFDGTFFSDDELIELGVGNKTARRMGHVPIRDSLEILAGSGIGRCIYIHVNNTNPIWHPGHQRASIQRHGFEVAFDGMEATIASDNRQTGIRAAIARDW